MANCAGGIVHGVISNEELGGRVVNCGEGRKFTVIRGWVYDAICNLDVVFLGPFRGDKINLAGSLILNNLQKVKQIV